MPFSLVASSRSSTACLETNIKTKRRYASERNGSEAAVRTDPPWSSVIIRSDGAYPKVCEMSLQGVISKRADAPYSPAIAAFGSRSNARAGRSSAGPIPQLRVRLPITTRTRASFMPGASELELITRSSAYCGTACDRSRSPEMPLDEPSLRRFASRDR